MDFYFEKKLKQSYGHKIIAGVDEVGRGPLAGPVTAAAFIFIATIGMSDIPMQMLDGLRDSKLLSAVQRERLHEYFCQLKEQGKVDFAWASCFPTTVDKRQIHHAAVLAMRRAVRKLNPQPHFVIIDGLRYPRKVLTQFEYKTIAGADNIAPSCAAASIVAKVRRDRSMREYYHKKYPEYRFDLHKGYGTNLHYKMLSKYGPSPIHRKSFRLA